MKLKAILMLTPIFISCADALNSKETSDNSVVIRSDVLLRTIAQHPYSTADKKDELTLTISGKNFIQGTVTFQVIDNLGQEVHCETFPATDLIQPEYKTANSTLLKAHIKEVAEGYFVDYSRSDFIKVEGIADTLTELELF